VWGVLIIVIYNEGLLHTFFLLCNMNSIRTFIDDLKLNDDIIVVKEYVDPCLEIAEFADREMKQSNGGKALLFENNGTNYPLIINMLGSRSRISKALYCDDPDQKSQQMQLLFEQLAAPKNTFASKLKTLPLLGDISHCFPKTLSGKGKCQEVVEDIPDLSTLPILKCWPYDGGRFITLPMVHTVDPTTKIRNVGMYRVQVLDKNTVAMHWHLHKTGARHFAEYKKLNRKMPCAVVLGGDPLYTYCATAPLPDGIDEYLLAGFLRNKPVKLVKCITQPEIMIPSDADIVIEGYIDPEEDFVLEGPFGDHTGFYSLADYYPKFHVTCITHRKDAIYPATIVGVPPMEDAYISYATEKIFKFPIRLTYAPELEDLHMPPSGVEHNIALAKINNVFPGNALKVKNALWGAGQMMFNKILVVFSGQSELSDYKNFVKEALKNFRANTCVHIENTGVSDVLDHSSRHFACGGKLCLDCTSQIEKDGKVFDVRTIDHITIQKKYKSIEKIDASLLGMDISIVFIILNSKPEGGIKQLAIKLVGEERITPKILIFVDCGIPDGDYNLLAWYASGNVDPATDCYVIDDGLGGVLCMDSTAKTLNADGFARQWPEVVMSDNDTIEKVSKKKYISENEKLLTSPSIKLQKLRYNDGAVKFFNSK